MPSLITRLLVSIFVVALVSCDSTDAFYVDAGADQTVQTGGAVTLVGTADSPDGSITSYEWVKISGEIVVLTGENTSSASFTAPIITADTVLIFQLMVNDDRGGRVTDDVNVFVTVLPPVDPENPTDPTPPPPNQATSLETEPNNILSEANSRILADTISGQVANDTDQDWFEVNLVAGTNYRIQFAGSEGSEGRWGVNVYDTSSSLLALMAVVDNSSAVSNANLDIGVGAAGKYYVVVESYNFSVPTQPYAVTVITSPISKVEIETNDSLLTADALTIAEAITGQVANDTDQDWFSFSATESTNYQILFEGSEDISDLASAEWNVNVYDSSNNLLASTPVDGSDVASSASLNVGIGAAGTYYIVVEYGPSVLSEVPTQPYTVTVNVL